MKISSIHRRDAELTVDIEVANTHTYQLSNGAVSHNTVSQFVNCASGIHARHNPYYIRTVRNDKKDPLSNLLIQAGVPHETDCMNPSAWVFNFPMRAPDGAVCRNDRTAIEQLELWKVYQLNWCEHKPSVTVSVKEHEWMEVGAWVWENFDIVSGISFLPFSEHTYRQAPYQDIDEETYNAAVSEMPVIDWTKLREFEKEDNTTGSHEYACAGGACEIV
jgi:ribonucleoside-diphosphate reductase alpha chain